MNINQINEKFIRENKLLIHIENLYSSILNESLICFETKTENEKKIFEDNYYKKISIDYFDMLKKYVNQDIKVSFMIVSKEYLDKYCDGILHYAMY